MPLRDGPKLRMFVRNAYRVEMDWRDWPSEVPRQRRLDTKGIIRPAVLDQSRPYVM
jgi:hypothetical protein